MKLKSKSILTSLVWITTTLVGVPLVSLAEELGTQGFNFEGRPIETTASFNGGFLTEEGQIRGEGSINSANPVNITGQINVDPIHLGQLADLVVYVHYSVLEDPTIIPLMLAEDRSVLFWNSAITSLVPFVKQTPLQATHSLDIYNGLLPDSKLQIYFGYLLMDGTLITNKLPIDISVEPLPEAEVVEAIVAEESEAQIDTTPLLTEESEDDGRLVGQYAYRWPLGTTLKVGFDFDGADFNYTPAPCQSRMTEATCESTVAEAVIKTVNAWSQVGNIYFRKTSWEDADIRVRFREAGSWSYVGTVAKNISRSQPTMNLAFSFLRYAENFRGTVLHEFGHAIGLHHEHLSPNVAYQWNEEQIIAELARQGWDANKVRANVINSLLNSNSRSAFFITQFDPQSIMIYAIPGSWVSAEDLADPQKCPDASSRYYCVARNTNLSTLDKQGIAGFYPQRSLGKGCSYTYDPSNYRPGTALWDGHTGAIKFNNPTAATVKVTIYQPTMPQLAFGSWNVLAGMNASFYYGNERLAAGMDWGIQVNNSPICILKVVSDWSAKGSYFQTSATRIPGM